MADLNGKIAALEVKIEGYCAERAASSDKEEKLKLLDVISSTRAYLTELLKQQSATGKPPLSTSLLSSSSFHPLFCSTLTPFCLFSASPFMSSICSPCCHTDWRAGH
jgi:hypothetical protein